MRYLLATLLVCALGAPVVEAKSASKSAAAAKPAKSKKSGGSDLGGIHPLVGSGGY